MPPSLFGDAPDAPGHARVRPAEPDPAHRALAERLRGLRLGTSSWSFPGWQGQVWRDRLGSEALSAHGLPAYAAHPLLRTVSIDSSYYTLPDAGRFARYAAQVPDDFRFVVKAPAVVGSARLRGEGNPHALDPTWVEGRFRARLAELGDRLGAVLLQVPPQPADAFGDRFFHRLAAVLALPVPWVVEVRTRAWLREDLAHVCADTGAIPVLSIHPALPDLRTQWRLLGLARVPALHVRWNLAPSRTYEEAKRSLAPFDRLAAPDLDHRGQLAKAIHWALEQEKAAWVIANNKAEGCAPATLIALAEAVAAL